MVYKTGVATQVVEGLPTKCEILSSKSSTMEKNDI
jgi:hypothetical protein